MIDIGITGGETIVAGELVRVLINHPDASIKWIAGQRQGLSVAHVHKGLLGECDLRLTEPDASTVDVVFNCDSHDSEWCEAQCAAKPQLRVIDLSRTISSSEGAMMYGLCEINRKFMVHDCYGVVRMPRPEAMLSLLSLIPLAVDHNLEGDIEIEMSYGTMTPGDDVPKLIDEITNVLRVLQPGFAGKVSMKRGADDPTHRGIASLVKLPCSIDVDALKDRYEDYYDDHNFTFITDMHVDIADVANTNKCLLELSSDNGCLRVKAVADSLLKGSAGNAVHVMNLLFGLHERAGLALKAQVY